MVMRFIGAGIAAALCVAFCALLPTPAFAAGESYAWTDYSAIGGKGGAYRDAVNMSEGGTFALDFKQSAENPAVFTVEPGIEGCNGTLTLTLSPTGNTGILTSSGDCPLYSDLDRTVTVNQSNLINSKVTTDSSVMKTSFEGNSCNEVQDKPDLHEQCITQANTAYEQHANACKAEADYTRATYLANKYLDCLAERLGVDRPTDEPAEETEPGSNTNCAIPDVGWLMCQAMEFLGWITDQGFNLLSSMLEVEPLKQQVDNEDSKLYAAWKVFLGFANVVFVFAFLFMIIAYTTNWGLGAYNLKKLAPRMIIAALLVNLSFFLCGIAVDLSNILGGTLKNTLVEMTPPTSGSANYSSWSEVTKTVVSITPNDETYTTDNEPGADRSAEEEEEEPQPSQTPPEEEDEAAAEEKDLWPEPTSVLLGGLMLVGGMVLWANLAALVPFMTTALIAIITVLIVLIIRQAVIIVLIAVSPIAMALYVLPNTKKWLDRWFDIFSKFLLIYPAVALVFGASYFASRVILDQATENGQTFLAMFALGIQVIPLFITPIIMKFGAGVLDRFGGIVNNPNKGPFDALKRRAGEFREDRRNQQLGRAAAGATAEGKGIKNFLRNPNAARLRRNMKRDAGDAAIDAALSRSKKIAANSPDAIMSAAKGIKPGEFYDSLVEESLADAAKELDDIKVGRIHAAEARFKNAKDDAGNQLYNEADIQNMALSGRNTNGKALTDVERAAAVQMAANTATSEQAHKLILASGNMDKAIRRILVDNLRKSGFSKQNSHFGGSALNDVIEGKITTQEDINERVRRAAEGGKYSSAAIANQSAYSLSLVNSALSTEGHLSGAAHTRIVQNARGALSNPTIEKSINTNSRAGVERLAR